MVLNARVYLVSLVAVFLVACETIPQPQQANNQIIKSPADYRDYRAITLDNGLKVMLVSDKTATQSAAALDVHVGSGHDPQDRQGLAHYLEHMLFLGTDPYPEAGEYQQYISENGGSNNAYTVLDHTNYFFDITPEFFEGALDRFSQFFISPLFNPENVTRERSIVNSEYQARKNDEGRRLWTARRVVYDQSHPSTHFSVGSLVTLADRPNAPVREDLIEFYQRYYHAPRMALSVISPHSLDQLAQWVEAKFHAIPAKGEAYTPFKQTLVQADKLPIELRIKPIKEARKLTFSFPIDSVYGLNSRPASYLSNLLGHEGEGSMLAVLKARAWANGLSAGLGYSDPIQASFDVSISLSELGFEHIDEIAQLLFSNIRLIQSQGIQATYFDEQKQLAALDFQFQEKSAEGALVQRLASMLHRYSASEVLSVPYLMGEFDAKAVQGILSKLRADNLQLIITDPNLAAEQKTDWYDVVYQVNEIAPSRLAHWQQATEIKGLTLPETNPFVPSQVILLDATVAESGANRPTKLSDTGNVQVWHQRHVTFGQPKAELYFTLRSQSANASPKQALLTELYVDAVDAALSAYAYPAQLAGLDYQIYRHSRGLSVRISGYADKQGKLLEKIVNKMQNVDITETQFSLYVENLKRGLDNSLKARPSERVINGLYDVLLTSSWSTEEKQRALAQITLDDLKSHHQILLSSPNIVLLAVGNVSAQASSKAGEIVAGLVPAQAVDVSVMRAGIRKLAPDAMLAGEQASRQIGKQTGQWWLRHRPALHDDAAVALVFQGSSRNIEELAATQLLGALIHPPYYQKLRTESEIGYIVSAFAFNLLEAPALGFNVQSNSHSVEQIVSQSQTFMQDYVRVLSETSEMSFAATKAGLMANLAQEEKQLSDVANRYWSELDREAYGFDTRERLIAAIEALDKPGIEAYYQDLVLNNASALLSYSFGDKSDGLVLDGLNRAGTTKATIDSLQSFRMSHTQRL
ncbi:MAG: insulinase family protein [Arenicellales bacterium]